MFGVFFNVTDLARRVSYKSSGFYGLPPGGDYSVSGKQFTVKTGEPMTQHKPPVTGDRLVTAYNRMMERVRALLDEAGHKALPTLQHRVDAAREKAVELGELTREEAEKIGEYLKRDIEDVAEYLSGPSQ